MIPNTMMLGNWLSSWVQPNGAINGFHNHSVWGGNPYRWSDFTCGHSTFASPFLAGLSIALSNEMNENGLELLHQMIEFQTNSFQKNGQYKHIGFQVGESLEFGLIHNAIVNISLGLTALYGREFLPQSDLESIRSAILRNMEGCRIYGEGRTNVDACCNQDYARIWGKLLLQKVFEDTRYYNDIIEDLNFMIENFHLKGIPDNECEATFRALTNRDKNIVEPAEYYGLMIKPLILAYEMYENKSYLEHAGALCRHVVRSAWKDNQGQMRFHRLWYRDSSKELWTKMKSPMLIAGMGMTLDGIQSYLKHVQDDELSQFLEQCDSTYAYYQTPRGYFVSATGWQSEVDIAPCSAWHSHDFYYLVKRHGISPLFWETFKSKYNKISVLLGEQCIWMEDDEHWTITDYFTQSVFKLLGRKDYTVFGRDMDWAGGERALPKHFKWTNMPIFAKTENEIYLKEYSGKDLDISCIASVPYNS